MRATPRFLLILTAALGLLDVLVADGALAQPAANDNARSVIVGKIVDESKNPVAGATVTALDNEKSRPVKSNADGSFRLPYGSGLRTFIYVALLVEGPKGELGFLSVQQTKPAPVEVIVKAPQEFAVQVTDAGAKPVGGADVCVLAAYRQVAAGITDADGRWAGRLPVDAANANTWAVFARKGKVGFDYVLTKRYESHEATIDPLPRQLKLKLDGARTLRVKTVDRDGKPLAGIKVGPSYIHMPGRESHITLGAADQVLSTTDQDGIAIFDWLPERFVSAMQFHVRSENYYAVDSSVSLSAKKPVAELTIRLLPFERLSGRVTHADGQPAAGIHVRAAGTGNGYNGFRGMVRTGADGRFTLKVHAEQAYVVAIAEEKWAAPYRGSLVVRAGKPVDGVDFVLGPVTRVHGRVILGKEERAAPDVSLQATINLGHIPPELRDKEDRTYHQVGMFFWAETGKDGRYELFLGPGVYELSGPPRTKMVKITIPAEKQPREIVNDFVMPRPETGPLAGRVVDEKKRPVTEAVVVGYYASYEARRMFRTLKTGADGKFQVERSLDPLVLHARTSDGKQAGIARIGADAATVEIVVHPVASATGRLLDLSGKPLAQAKLRFGISIYMGEEDNSPFVTAFGGQAVTNGEGRFALDGLVAGEKYRVNYPLNDHSFRHAKDITPKGSMSITLGDLRIDTEPHKPYVPPTPTERTAKAFVPPPSASAIARKDRLLIEARREYTRPLLLFGQPKDAACIDLFRLFNEDSDNDEKQPRQSPYSLRWEFELASLDVDQPEVRKLAEALGVEVGKGRAPILAVLNADGSLAATYSLILGPKQMLDTKTLTDFMGKHKLPQRDAEKMLAEALKTARAEDKRVFFITSASWCGPCRLLGRFLEPWKKELNRHYVFVKLDVSRDDNARAVTKRFQGDSDGGVPWFAILDHDAKVLITSNVPDVKRRGKAANIGFPSEERNIEHFLKMLSQTAPRLAEPQIVEMRAVLQKKP